MGEIFCKLVDLIELSQGRLWGEAVVITTAKHEVQEKGTTFPVEQLFTALMGFSGITERNK